MNQLTSHNQTLRSILESTNSESLCEIVDLDSIDIVLRGCLTIDEMREAGSFFTGQKLAAKLINSLTKPITLQSKVLDPTCGAGNLLIQCSRQLSVKKKLSQTLEQWGKVLWGFDLHEHFIEATKLRLACEASSRGAEIDCNLEEVFDLLPNIRVADALTIKADQLKEITHTVLNPPFTIWPSPKNNYWNAGKVNAAGIVFDAYLRILPERCSISAILPDVLRSGSRYGKFRDFVSYKMEAKCAIWGQFNARTDVDVFTISGNINTSTTKQVSWFEELGDYKKLSDFYDVRIGPLVAYRDPEEGPLLPYFYPKNCPAWQTIEKSSEMRRFNKTHINPPIVVIKRTSSPSNKDRASATIINLNTPVAIENHLIIIKPKNGTLDECEKLLNVLKSEKTNDFLNQRARMRHLTVDIVKKIPINKV